VSIHFGKGKMKELVYSKAIIVMKAAKRPVITGRKF
jgi:hypothetical protein